MLQFVYIVDFFCLFYFVVVVVFFYQNPDDGFSGGASNEEPTCQCRRHKRHKFAPWVGKIPWSKAWQPTPVFLYGESQGQRSLVGYGP